MPWGPTDDDAPWSRALRRAFERGRTAHPTIALGFASYARHALVLAHARSGDESRVGDVLDRCAAEDLYLAIACEEQVAGAWERLHADLSPRLRGLGRRRGMSDAEAESLATDVLGDLALPAAWAKTRTLLGTFDGTGNLFAWAAVLLVRRVSRASRAPWAVRRIAADPVDAESAGRAVAATSATDGPFDAASHGETAERFRAAFEVAWGHLSPSEQAVLAFKHRDGLPQREIARILGVGEAWVSRLAARATEALGARIRARVDADARDAGDPGLVEALREVVRSSWARIASTIAPPTGGAPPPEG